MSQPTTVDAETLRTRIREYLERAGHDGDAERIAQRLARAHAQGTKVVGFRRRGREVVLYEAADPDGPSELSLHRVGRSGRLTRSGTIGRNGNLGRWLAAHRYYLEWVRPDLRAASSGRDGDAVTSRPAHR
ncbi:hypothetical protein [Halovivax sp.]|uniref:hypothetical protein n=1 Tax=Halovivax sp. TaxID=1935978 RepID=UPI0025C54980|nr:hypothetical protein [Halovivax sp.]